MALQPDYVVTITLTSGSKNFTTTGATLQTRGVQEGDTIFLPAKGTSAVIASITGQNAGTLTDNCPAALAGAGQVGRIRFQADLSRVAAYTRELIQLLGAGNNEELAGLDGTGGDKVPYFTGAGAMATAAMNARGRAMLGLAGNADTFGSYLRLTGASSAAMAPIMGAMANGALQDYGSNANGYYARFANGLLVCVGVITMDITNAQSISGLYQGNTTWTFPSGFGRTTNLVGFTSGQVGNAWGSSFNVVNNVLAVVRAFGAASISGATVYAAAIGRWD